MALTQIKTTGLADDAVTSAKIADDAVVTAAIADDAVTGANIADDTVAEANMANDAIGLAELKAGTDGQILTFDASGNPSFVGPGSDGQVLTSTGAGSPPAFEAASGGATINNATENEIVTVASTTSQLDAEAKFTYDGNTAVLQTTSDGNAINVVRNSADANPVNITLTKSRNATYGSNTVVNNADVLGEIVWKADDGTDYATEAAAIRVDVDGAPGGNDMPSRMEFFTTADGGSTATKRLTINNAGNVQVEDGNLQILTSGHGVEFSAFATSGNPSSNLLDDYEEGTWTPVPTFGGANASAAYGGTGTYIKVGRICCTGWNVIFTNKGSSTGQFQITGLPFTPSRSSQGTSIGYLHRVYTNYAGQLCGYTSGTTLWFGSSGIDGNFVNWDEGDLRNDTHLGGVITYVCD